jgi:hypothetical protein
VSEIPSIARINGCTKSTAGKQALALKCESFQSLLYVWSILSHSLIKKGIRVSVSNFGELFISTV